MCINIILKGNVKISIVLYCIVLYILLTKREGRTGRISARGLDSTDRAKRGPYKKDSEGRYSPSTVPNKLGQ